MFCWVDGLQQVQADLPPGEPHPKGDVKSVDSEELAMILDAVSSVIIVPGYGMAVAQAQHAVRDFMNVLEKKGINVDLLFTLLPVECPVI